jgi:hypothetical protein
MQIFNVVLMLFSFISNVGFNDIIDFLTFYEIRFEKSLIFVGLLKDFASSYVIGRARTMVFLYPLRLSFKTLL